MTAEHAVAVDVQVASDAADIPDEDAIRAWVRRAAAAADVAPATEISVRIVDEDEIRQLNRDFRDKDTPTNVLSFPVGDLDGLPAEAARLLGDIVICAGVVSGEAGQQGKAAADHWAHMLVHGTLHLLGFDHIQTADAETMEALEVRILAENNVPDPYRVP